MFLVISECSIFKNWFERNWPVLSNAHGFNFLGLAMVILGNNILGNLNKEATSQKSLGLPFWRIVIGSGIIVFALGFINLIAVGVPHPFLKIIVTNNKLQSYIFQDKKLKVTARQVRSKGAVAISDKEAQLENPSKPSSIVTSFPTPSYAPSSAYSQATSPIKKSPVRRFMHNARQSILPSYRSEVPPYPRTPPGGWPTSPVKAAKTGESEEAAPMEISAPLNVNPQFAHLVRPNLAHHPTNRRGDGSF